jgi:hypothetical protein
MLYIQSGAPDDGRKHRPKHLEPTWNNKLIYIVHLVGYFRSYIMMHGFMKKKKKRVIKNSELHDYVSSYYHYNQNYIAVVQDNTVEESHHVLNNCSNKDNFNVIVAQKKIMF